ncbi:TlpA family protein disulfide reductase [Kribbella capetownensis]|uniref:TlpA family protein disulfide reductase n=1 Tax=Kribbella capetownensis TaxID=1572659 RepID=A0A4V2M8S0_9ACTN|nr:TlpA disulfide reductase family protein [Kribbella capetownensis]TCC52502.1 TlpA family protein disulfide reductase [Kribbella capetownensis]
MRVRTTLWAVGWLVAGLLLASCGPDQPSATDSTSPSAVAGADKLAACPSTESKPPVSNGLPDVSLPCLGSGPDIRLADLRGPLVINVWAQWCGPCREEAPYLADLAKRATGKLQLLGIDYDDPRAELAVKFAGDQQLSYPHLVDPDKQLRQPFKIGGPPISVFVNSDGAIAYVHHGPFTSRQQLDQLVRDKLGVTL